MLKRDQWEVIIGYHSIELYPRIAEPICFELFVLTSVRIKTPHSQIGNLELINSSKIYFDVPINALDTWFDIQPCTLLIDEMVAYSTFAPLTLELKGMQYRFS